MDRNSALNKLKKIAQPILQDGGKWQFGHIYHILTEEGLFTEDCTTYEPIHGPIRVSENRFADIKKKIKDEEDIESLKTDEQLLFIHGGKPDIDYWAFQPFDDAPIEEYTLSSDKAVIENILISGESVPSQHPIPVEESTPFRRMPAPYSGAKQQVIVI